MCFLIVMGSLVACILTFTNYASAGGLVQLFNMDAETTITAYFSSFNLAIAAAVLWFIAYNRKQAGDAYWRHWGGLAAGFFLLSLDETASIHETIVMVTREHLHVQKAGQYGVAMLGLSLVAALAVVYFKFLAYLPARSKKRFLLAGAIFVGGAFVAEGFAGYLFDRISTLGIGYYNTEVVVEESMEMLGIILFIRALFLHIEENMLLGGSKAASAAVPRAAHVPAAAAKASKPVLVATQGE